jgi:HAMP domain-containing protein
MQTLFGQRKKSQRAIFPSVCAGYGEQTEIGQLMKSFNAMTEELAALKCFAVIL